MAIEEYSKKQVLPEKVNRNLAGNLVIVGLVGFYILLMSLFAHAISPVLSDHIVNKLEINEDYVDGLLLFTFLFFSLALVVVVVLLDGENKRIQTLLYKYTSKMMTKGYYDEKPVGGQAGSEVVTQPNDGSVRAAASVRPTAVIIEDDYKQGKVDGTFKEFYENGQVKREVRYTGGKLEGLFRTFYENGQVEQEGIYRDGQFDGLYKSYYDNGGLHQHKEYKDGKLNGMYKAIDERSIPFFEINYKEGKQHGEDKTFDQAGVIQFSDTYVNGILINRKTYNEFGTLKYDQDFEDAIEEAAKIALEQKAAQRLEKQKEKRKEK